MLSMLLRHPAWSGGAVEPSSLPSDGLPFRWNRRRCNLTSWWRRFVDVRGRGLTRFSVAGQGQQPPAGDRGDQVPDRDVWGEPGAVGERGRRDRVECVT